MAQVAQRGCESPSTEIFKTQTDTVLGNFQVTLPEQKGWTRWCQEVPSNYNSSGFKIHIWLLLKFGRYMPSLPVYVSIWQLDSPFASWSPCSAASRVLGTQNTLLHLTTFQRYLISAQVLQYWQSSEAGHFGLQTQSVSTQVSETGIPLLVCPGQTQRPENQL